MRTFKELLEYHRYLWRQDLNDLPIFTQIERILRKHDLNYRRYTK